MKFSLKKATRGGARWAFLGYEEDSKALRLLRKNLVWLLETTRIIQNGSRVYAGIRNAGQHLSGITNTKLYDQRTRYGERSKRSERASDQNPGGNLGETEAEHLRKIQDEYS